MIQKIIVLCTGNICRSPIAAEILRNRLPRHNVHSAGTAALVNHSADATAQQVAAENGWDISSHRAQQATWSLLASMDLILVLDQSHREWIRFKYPELMGRTHKLGRWHDNQDIDDPYRQPKAVFEHAYTEIERCARDWITRL